ncbi:MAG: glycerol-3-phosphate 1-O-acyltransferase PlsY [Paracoccaceae bacterium]
MPPFETASYLLIVWALVGYLLGSIPFGIVLSRVFGLGNLRDIGSGNIGATNVLRTGNKAAAALTLILDGAKGAIAVLLARSFAGGEDAVQIAALMAMLGHCFPVWLGFRGGKGVATFLGTLIALSWPVGIGCCLAWLVAAAMTRMSSMGALVAAATSTMLMVALAQSPMVILGVLLTTLVFVRHHENIRRIRAGTEPKIGQKTA